MNAQRFAFLLALPLLAAAGCVSMNRFEDQENETAAQRKRGDGLQSQFDALKSSSAAVEQDLTSRLAAVGSELASAQVSNRDLAQSLEAKKGELAKEVAALIKDRDAQAQKATDLQKQLSDVTAAKAAAEAAAAAEIEKTKKSYEDLNAGLKSEIAAGQVKITQLQGKLTVNMVDKILFDSGKAEIKEDGRKVLDTVGGVLNTVADKRIRIEGHTDNVPIGRELRSKYESNWELSTARATAIARYLQDRVKVDPTRLVAAGYGEYRPIVPNDTPESRAQNRRIEIILVPKD